MIFQYCIFFFDGYLVGSIPTAYLIVLFKWERDVRKAGSGKVGAFNAYNVSQSKSTGIIVGVLDGLKGFLVALAVGQVFGYGFWLQAVALLGTIIGHNYPIWLRFRGGRGLAPAAGGLCAIGISYTLVWSAVWYAAFRSSKQIIPANLTAIIASPFILLILPGKWLEFLMIRNISAGQYRLFAFLISAVHLLSHGDEIRYRIVLQKGHAS
ncbi:MAG: glycerol-3-phosphate acyltransferase [Bacteroidota bacterium]